MLTIEHKSRIVKLNGKYYDFGTKNKSFLITANELRTLGINNWYFMLEIKYPQFNISDIDPFDPNLTPDQIGKIHIESAANLWYWLREIAPIPAQGSPKPYSLVLTRASCAATWCYIHGIDFLLCQPRQTWKTTIAMLLTEYSFIYKYNNVIIPFLHITEPRCMENAGVFRSYVDSLPNYMNPFYGKKKMGLKSLKYEEHNTSIKIVASADSPIKAKDKLRGLTLFSLLGDEWEFIPHINYVLTGASPAVISGRKIAAENGLKTCMMYVSTPGDPETPQGKAAEKIIAATPRFSERFYDLTEEQVACLFDGMEMEVEGEEKKQQVTSVYIEFNYKQLRKDEKYLREQYAEAVKTGDVVEYRRGVLLDRFRDSSTSIFKQEDIDFIKANKKEPDNEILLINKYPMYIYNHHIDDYDPFSDYPFFDINIPYLIGIDVATGSGGDNTAIVIVNPYTLDIVAECKSPYMGTFDLMECISMLAKIIPRGIFCPETNSIGKTIVEYVQRSSLYHRFYHDPRLDMSKNATIKESAEERIKRESKERGFVGVYVTSTVRDQMFTLLKTVVHECRDKVASRFLVEDIDNLVKNKSGKIAADAGKHDDIVMAYNHVIYILYYGANLLRFGIDKSRCTYNKGVQSVKDYEKSVELSTVKNIGIYDRPTIHEDRMCMDLLNNPCDGFDRDGCDEYGYRRSDYVGGSKHETVNRGVSASEAAFFYEMLDMY